MNAEREDIGVLQNYELDLAFGSDENSFECVVDINNHCCGFGFFLYVEGTEYGGIIDSVEIKNSNQEIVYRGRTWHGVLNSKVLEPDPGADYLVCNGEANAVISSLVSRMGLSNLFIVSDEASGLAINNYKMNRYISGYDGIMKMLKTVDGKLQLRVQNNGKVLLSVVPVVDYTEDCLDSDLIDLDVKRTANTVNHLICLGQGNLADRLVVHLYVDKAGNISRTQTITGVDEYVAVYDYSGAEDEDDLVNNGIEHLKELMQQDDLSVDVNDVDDPYDVGDLVGATDNITNISITVPVKKKIVTIKNGVVTIDIKTETSNVSTHANETSGVGSPGEAGADGQDGKDGQDGVSCTHKWNGTVLTVTSASGTSSADLKGERGEPGKDGKDGADGSPGQAGSPGKDGISCTHSWSGTTLSVTSASGTSSANLKGETGTPGKDGSNGVSCTHSWNGTSLTVTSASGTSSANLKGDKGDTGSPGSSGVYVGSTKPTDSTVNVWIDPNGEGQAAAGVEALTVAEIRSICT